jgi:hypothetical protein
MNKINPLSILIDHIGTLSDSEHPFRFALDIALFYFVPCLLSIFAFHSGFKFNDSAIFSLITVFAVFAPLLFSAQVAVFSISRIEPRLGDDDVRNAVELNKSADFRRYLGEVNSNVSYLVFLACLFLVLYLIMLVFAIEETLQGAVVCATVTHFFLTLMMVIKRCHVAFSIAYR